MSGIPPRMNNQGYRTDYHSIPMGMQTPDMQMAQQLMKVCINRTIKKHEYITFSYLRNTSKLNNHFHVVMIHLY